jgi:zinc/manganese transport system substrate-binding protein
MILNRRTVAIAVALAAAALGCSDDEAHGEAPIVATTSIWADVTSAVACGEPVPAIIPPGTDPHDFEPSLRDRETLGDALVVVANGLGLEESLEDVLDAVQNDGVAVIEAGGSLADPLAGGHDEAERENETGEEHDEEGIDPHVWQDPSRVAAVVDAIADALVTAGRDAAEIDACADAYAGQLAALDAEIVALLARVPAGRRVMVTNHDAFAYFAARYDFEIVGTVVPSLSTIGEASTGELADLADLIEARDVPAIFTEELASDADARALAGRLGIAVVALVSDALASEGEASTYLGMMRTNAAAIAAALGG